jgi:putative ribosome biogenesis GTPase RsgA
MKDNRESLVACWAHQCRFNSNSHDPEPHCNLKLIVITDEGRCKCFEGLKT